MKSTLHKGSKALKRLPIVHKLRFGNNNIQKKLQTELKKTKTLKKKYWKKIKELHEALELAKQNAIEIAKERDDWKQKKIPKGILAKFKFIFKNS